MSERNRTIGVFDSGVGGLTVLDHLVHTLPEYDFDYFGDTARCPYGARSRATITHFTEQGTNFLFDRGAALVIIACNTASAVALHHLQNKYLRDPGVTDLKILGIVVPTIEAAAEWTTRRSIALLGTNATVASKTYEQELQKIAGHLQVEAIACPLFVPIVEAGWEDTEVARMTCAEYLAPLHGSNVDTVVLGCTHYPFLREALEATLPKGVRIIEQGPVVARRTRTYLERHPEIEGQLRKTGRVRFYSSDSPEQFASIGAKYFRAPLSRVSRVDETTAPPEQRHRALVITSGEDHVLDVPFGWRG